MTIKRAILLSLLLFSAFLMSCGGSGNFPVLPSFDFKTYSVVYCSPANLQSGISPDTPVNIVFNNNADIEDAEQNFSLTSNGTRLEGSFSWTSQRSFSFIPRYQLKTGQRYVIQFPRSTRDSHGNKMGREFISEFYVGSDFTRPGVISSMPMYVTGGVTVDPYNPADPNLEAMTALRFQFSKPMNRIKTQASFSISPDVPGYFDATTSDDQLRYVFTTAPAYGKQYKVTISAVAEDQSGNALSRDFFLIFTVGIDTTPPSINSIGDGVDIWQQDIINEGVEKDLAAITVNYSEPMERNSCENSFSISPSAAGYFTWANNNQTMIFNVTAPLAIDSIYTIRMDTVAEDSHGLKIEIPHQVVIRTNGPLSRKISIDDVDGRDPLTPAWSHLLPEQAGWPTPINLNGGNSYIFKLHFTSEGNPIVMDKLSIFGNNLIEDYISGLDPAIVDIDWENDEAVWITIDVLFINSLYRLTILGGSNGLKDINGNTMTDNFIIDFRQ